MINAYFRFCAWTNRKAAPYIIKAMRFVASIDTTWIEPAKFELEQMADAMDKGLELAELAIEDAKALTKEYGEELGNEMALTMARNRLHAAINEMTALH